MTIAYLLKPGSEFGPCAGDSCKHPEHESTRQKAKTLCQRCAKPIGYSTGFHDIGGQLWHHNCAIKAGVLHAPPQPKKEQSNMPTTTKKAAAKKAAAPKKEAKAKVPVQYYRDGKPITNPSVNSLSGVAFFHAKGWKPESQRVVKDGETLDRVSVETLEAFLAKHGIKDARTTFGPIELPGGQKIHAIAGKLVDHQPRVAKAQSPEAVAKKAATKKAATNVRTAKAEMAALQAWEDGGKKGDRPATPTLDATRGKLDGRSADAAAKAAAPAKKATPKAKAPAAAKTGGKTFRGPIPKPGAKKSA